MLVAEIAVLTATSLAALLVRKPSGLPRILALQSVALTVLELPKLIHLDTPLALPYLAAAAAHATLPPFLLAKIARALRGRIEEVPRTILAASTAVAAATIALSLFGAPRILLYAMASLVPILAVAYSRDPVRVAASLNMASNALHPIIVAEGTIAYAAASNISITMVIYVAYILAREGWKTYGSASLEGWDRWLKR